MRKIKKEHIFLAIILAISLFFRFFRYKTYFGFGHDIDLIGWFVKDVLSGDLRLIGQETSTHGIFIGPYFYYLLVPFFWVAKMDPIGGVFAVTILGVFATWSYWYVFSKIFNEKVGLVAGFFHAASFFLAINEREVNPTQPVVFLWTVWFLYSVFLLLKGKKTGYLLSGLLIGLIWNINFGLVLVLPLIPLSILLSKKRVNQQGVFWGLLVFFILSLPLFVFEARNNFQQSRSLIASLATDQKDVVSGVEKLERVLHLTSKNFSNLVFGQYFPINYSLSMILFAAGLVWLFYTKKIDRKLGLLLMVWFFAFISFFGTYSKIISEYYLNGLMVLWVLVSVLFLFEILKGSRKTGLALLFIYLALNLFRLFTYPVNKSGYLQRKEIVRRIKEDAQAHGYPCVSVSYITTPGYNFGYRYFFYLEDMHVNNPDSLSPVYTIVFPHRLVDKIDESFGALGLVLPDYGRYTKEGVDYSCSGENSNLTDSLFGYTK